MKPVRTIVVLGTALAVNPVFAESRKFGDWLVDLSTDQTYMYAATVNDSDEIFGEFCYFDDGTCHWVLAMDTRCDKDHVYPILANSSGGARHLEVSCMRQSTNDLFVYQFAWKDIESVVKGANWVGLTFPMNGDAFKVVRVSLNGIDASTRFLEGAFQKILGEGNAEKPKAKSTKSEVL